MKSFILLPAFALWSSALATQAISAPTSLKQAPVTRAVTYDDLDLSSKRGQVKLRSRILWAVSEVCPAANEISRLSPPTDIDCYNATKPSALHEMELAIARARPCNARLRARVVSAR